MSKKHAVEYDLVAVDALLSVMLTAEERKVARACALPLGTPVARGFTHSLLFADNTSAARVALPASRSTVRAQRWVALRLSLHLHLTFILTHPLTPHLSLAERALQNDPGIVHAAYAAHAALRVGADIRPKMTDDMWTAFVQARRRSTESQLHPAFASLRAARERPAEIFWNRIRCLTLLSSLRVRVTSLPFFSADGDAFDSGPRRNGDVRNGI